MEHQALEVMAELVQHLLLLVHLLHMRVVEVEEHMLEDLLVLEVQVAVEQDQILLY
jgi:hypothetical protein